MILNENLEKTRLEYDRASLGIRSPRVVTLLAGYPLFRFASTENPTTGQPIPKTEWARGAWWFQEADYRRIIDRYLAGKLGLGTVAKSAGAVQPSWSLTNVSVKAILNYDTEVYIGKGKTQYRDLLPNGMYMTTTGWPDLDQIYVPDLRGAASIAFHVLRQKIVTTDRFGF